MSTKSKILTVLSVSMLCLSFNAQAVPPSSETEIWHDDLFIVDCGTYDVRTAATMRERVTEHYNKAGEPVRLHISFRILESIYYSCPDDPGYDECAENPAVYIQQGRFGKGENAHGWIDLVTGEEAFTGAQFRLTIPGAGPVVLDAGRYHFDGESWYHTGIFIWPEGDTGDALCEVLEP